GLKETPQRVAKMYAEVFEGMNYTNEEIARMFDTTFEDEDYLGEQQNGKPNNMVAVTEIPIFSYCEHHMALMYNMTVSVAYLPKEKIIGLSKIARIADMVGRRLQLQERIGTDIAEIVAMVTESEDVAVLIKGEHSCMTARGIKKSGTVTRTATFRGVFEEDNVLRQEALLLLG
ncbi:MAG: GTP cyclohydrolase I, partial [Peptococcaceae bacterium]|nr:GTP cyclohydrolase I [Peptococcaceae bacterium]